MKAVAVCLLLAIVATAAGAPSGDQRIVSGTAVTAPADPTQPSQFPYVVSIEEKGNHICGGFIYNAKWVVTTASCLEGKSPSVLEVVVGQLNLIELEATEHKIPAFRIVPNDGYVSANRTNDIALIELSADIEIDDLSKAIIEYNEVDIDVDLDGTFMGWGATVDGGGVSPRLRYMTLIMDESNKVCGSYQATQFAIGSMICATPKPVDPATTAKQSPCTFDEGGPLVQEVPSSTAGETKQIAVGILSTHSLTCDPGTPSIFTRLSVHYAWLYRTAGPQTPPPV